MLTNINRNQGLDTKSRFKIWQLTECVAVPLLVNASNRFFPSCTREPKTTVVREEVERWDLGRGAEGLKVH